MIKIAIDTMGGDFGPGPIIDGLIKALKHKNFTPILVGNKEDILKYLPKAFFNTIKIVHTDDFIRMEDDATNALKRKESSIYKAIELVKNKEASAVVSAGHSGATMSIATLRLGRLKNISRPAIGTAMPKIDGSKFMLLDAGANTNCKSEQLCEFAIMGEVYAKNLFSISNPKVALLSNGEEEAKGNETTKEAFNKLKSLESFVGNIEGNNMFKNNVDVIVCDGFIGNIVLKTSEGLAESIILLLKKQIKKFSLAKLGALLMKKAFKGLKKQIDYDEYGGAPLLGVKECTIISHGKSNSKAIKNAIFQAIDFVKLDINKQIEDRMLEVFSKDK